MTNIKRKIYYFIVNRLIFFKRDSFILRNPKRKTKKNIVNLHYWNDRKSHEVNLGDFLSEIVVNYMLSLKEIDPNKEVGKTKHLYAIGSIIDKGYQDATIWGSGCLYELYRDKFLVEKRKLDIRCVRGPLTRNTLEKVGFNCPKIYGDPAILMPLIYKPTNTVKTRKYSVIIHMESNEKYENQIEINTCDYKKVIDEIVQSELIISSSLHGIILAEAYSVPAILLQGPNSKSIKFEDWYLSTGRQNFVSASSVQEALNIKAPELPDLRELQSGLLKSFPYDLWER